MQQWPQKCFSRFYSKIADFWGQKPIWPESLRMNRKKNTETDVYIPCPWGTSLWSQKCQKESQLPALPLEQCTGHECQAPSLPHDLVLVPLCCTRPLPMVPPPRCTSNLKLCYTRNNSHYNRRRKEQARRQARSESSTRNIGAL